MRAVAVAVGGFFAAVLVFLWAVRSVIVTGLLVRLAGGWLGWWPM